MRVNQDTGFDSTPCHPSVRWKWYQATDVPWSANSFTRKARLHTARDKETNDAKSGTSHAL